MIYDNLAKSQRRKVFIVSYNLASLRLCAKFSVLRQKNLIKNLAKTLSRKVCIISSKLGVSATLREILGATSKKLNKKSRKDAKSQSFFILDCKLSDPCEKPLQLCG